MKTTYLILVLFITTVSNSYALHKDKHFYHNYGNVKTFLKTGFNNTGEEIQVKIIGQLAFKLLQKLSYKDTIVLEFNHVYTKNYTDLIIVENGRTEQPYLINIDPWNIMKTQKESRKLYKNKGICIRQSSDKINIINTLKLIEYSIKNKIKEKRIKVKELVIEKETNLPSVFYEFLGLALKKVDRIVKQETSSLIKGILNLKTEFLNELDIVGFYQNKTYYFKTNEKSFSTPTLFGLTKLEKGFAVFTDSTSFVYLANHITDVKKFIIEDSGNYPFYFSKFNYFEKILLEKNVLISRFFSGKGILFSEELNQVTKETKRK